MGIEFENEANIACEIAIQTEMSSKRHYKMVHEGAKYRNESNILPSLSSYFNSNTFFSLFTTKVFWYFCSTRSTISFFSKSLLQISTSPRKIMELINQSEKPQSMDRWSFRQDQIWIWNKIKSCILWHIVIVG